MSDPIRVIYVEDSPLHAQLLRAGLSVYNIEVIIFDHGDERLIEEIGRSENDDAKIILIDLWMGDLTGLQIARRLRAEGDNRPIMVVSGGESPSNRELLAIQAMFVSKPFDFDQISEAIYRVAQR
ncbi:MAG TPA: response regulator [Aggregatilineales bacterium]|nr:response regulator [Aggregatilineales bacterium]